MFVMRTGGSRQFCTQNRVAAATAAGDLIWHTRERWVRSGRVISQRSQRHRRSGDLFADSLRKCVIGPSTVLLRRAAFARAGGFREDLEIAEDYELWLRLTARYPVGYLDQELVIKRAGHSDQLSERYGQIEIFRLRALHDLAAADHFGAGSRHRVACEELVRQEPAPQARRGRRAPAGIFNERGVGYRMPDPGDLSANPTEPRRRR